MTYVRTLLEVVHAFQSAWEVSDFDTFLIQAYIRMYVHMYVYTYARLGTYNGVNVRVYVRTYVTAMAVVSVYSRILTLCAYLQTIPPFSVLCTLTHTYVHMYICDCL